MTVIHAYVINIDQSYVQSVLPTQRFQGQIMAQSAN